MARRFVVARDLLRNVRGLVRVFRAVAESFMLAVLKLESHIFIRSGVTLGLVIVQNARRDTVLSEELSHQVLGSGTIMPTLHQYVGHDIELMYSAPKLMLFSVDRDDYLVQPPFFPKGCSGTNASRCLLAKLQHQAPNRSASHFIASSSQQFFDHLKGQESGNENRPRSASAQTRGTTQRSE